MAMEPTAVNTHDSSETAPSWAMLEGSMMIPEPIMLTITRVVSPVRPIFLVAAMQASWGGERSGGMLKE
ncbi:hypothetical protein Pssp01_49530 [Pseudomonas sp. NBRC 100443]|nr:hypothetical protein Pssp01_49530 [Pseudomonas sp. NBRC 100443]